MTAHGGEGDVPEQLCVSKGVRQVVPRGPDGRAPRCGLQRDERSPEGTAAEEEVSRCRELRRHAHAPVQVVAVGLHAQEGPCVHGAAPYRRWSSRRQLTDGRVRSARAGRVVPSAYDGAANEKQRSPALAIAPGV